MFSEKNLRSAGKTGHELVTPVQPKQTSSIGSSWNYSEEIAPLSDTLRQYLWSVVRSNQDLSERLAGVKLVTKFAKNMFARTNTGHCSVAMHTRLMTCNCCKFLAPEIVLEVRVFAMLAKYYDNTRYDGIAIRTLVPEKALGDLNYPPDLMLFQEMHNSTYTWSDHVSRYFSRFHWEAVHHEVVRLCKTWLDFMQLVNNSERVLLFTNPKLTKHCLENLSPLIPPQPPRGDFLLSKEHSASMRHSVKERVELFFTTACYYPYNCEATPRYQLCDVVDRFTVYSNEEGIPASGSAEPLVSAILLDPERKRRCINSIRECAPAEYGEYFSPPPINIAESTTSSEGSSIYAWKCTDATLQLCDYALGADGVPLWYTYIPGETQVTAVKHFWCSEHSHIESLMEALFMWRPCDGVCTVEVRLFNTFEELNRLGYFPCEYAISVAVNPESMGDVFGATEGFIKSTCVADNVALRYQFDFADCSGPCILVYKFDYEQRFQL